jgi:hypothetical protein
MNEEKGVAEGREVKWKDKRKRRNIYVNMLR